MGQTVVAIAMLRQYIFSPPFLNVGHILFFLKYWESVQGKKAADKLAKYISSVKGKQFKIETWLFSYKEDQKGRDRQANFFFFFQFTHFKNSHPYYIIMQLPGIQYS